MEKAKKRLSKKMQDKLSDKIRLLHHEGYPHEQAIAIAHNMLGLSKKQKKKVSKSFVHVVSLYKGKT